MGDDIQTEDAILFSGDPQALIFGAGVVHAQYVHAKNDPAHTTPEVVCGVSMGSLNAAAAHKVEYLLKKQEKQTKQDKQEKLEQAESFMAAYLQTMLGPQGVITAKWLTDSMPNINHPRIPTGVCNLRFWAKWITTMLLYIIIKPIRIKLGRLKTPLLEAFFQTNAKYSQRKLLCLLLINYNRKEILFFSITLAILSLLVIYANLPKEVLLIWLCLPIVLILLALMLYLVIRLFYGTGLTTTHAVKKNLKALFDDTHEFDNETTPHLVISTADLNPDEKSSCIDHQVKNHTDLIDTLSIAVSPVGLFALERKKKKYIVDGGVLRNNPLPALFNWAKNNTKQLESAVVVFGSPVLGAPVPSLKKPHDQGRPFNNFGTTGLTVLRLLRRSEMDLEIKQTKFLSKLAKLVKEHGSTTSNLPIALEIHTVHPKKDITLHELIKKQHTGQSYKIAAQGCASRLVQLNPHDKEKPCAFSHLGVATICQHCDKKLPTKQQSTNTSIQYDLNAHPEKIDDNGLLKKQTVVVVNGGVFRGSFHIGMIAAMVIAGLRPHAIFGASVGALMGAAMGSILRYDEMDESESTAFAFPGSNGKVHWSNNRRKKLKHLVELFEEVPNKVAFTHQLRFTTKLVIDLAINRYGTSPKISDFTRWLESPFILTEGIERIQRNVLEAHEIDSMMGSQLLRESIKQILSRDELNRRQPFERSKQGGESNYPIYFYATTTDLKGEKTHVLGRKPPNTPEVNNYSFVDSLLASSAFPLLFPPVPQKQIDPGGWSDILYCDGGIFDNLPIDKAIDWLSQKQTHTNTKPKQWNAKHRMILGALSSNPIKNQTKFKKSPWGVRKQSRRIQNNYKLYSYANHATKVSACIKALPGETADTKITKAKATTVQLDIQIIEPSSDDHINGTFSFSPLTGFEHERFKRSIVNGCYQTLKKLAAEDINDNPVEWRTEEKENGCMCPYFKSNNKEFECPFAIIDNQSDAKGMYKICKKDKDHKNNPRPTASDTSN